MLLGGKSALFSHGIKTIITTLGSKGYEIATEGEEKIYPAISVSVVDTTAAGDTASAGLCVGLSEGWSLSDSMAFGSLCASVACTKRGAQMSVPTRDEALSFLKNKK